MDQYSYFNSGPSHQEGGFWDQFSEEWQDILAAYALGALEPEEMIALDDYLQNHSELQGVVQRLDETVVAMAYAAPPALPSSAAKEKLMARVYDELGENRPNTQPQMPRQNMSQPAMPQQGELPAARAHRNTEQRNLSPSPFPRATETTALSTYRPNMPLRPAGKPPTARSNRLRARRPSRVSGGFFDFATGWKVATMATAAALLFFVIATVQLTGQLNRLNQQSGTADATVSAITAELSKSQTALASVRQEARALQNENNQLQTTAAQLAAQLQVDQQQLVSLLGVSQVVELGGTEFAPGAEGALFVGENSLVLILHGLQPLPDNQIYQLWLIPPENEPVSAGLVHVLDGMAPNLTTDVALVTTSFATVGLSVEPAGGSEQPTGDIVLLGNRT